MKFRLSLWILTAAVACTALGCAFPKAHNLPPAQQLLEPGPGVGGPGPGVLPPSLPPMMMPVSMPTVQVLFGKPEGMQVRWDVSEVARFDSTPLIVPGVVLPVMTVAGVAVGHDGGVEGDEVAGPDPIAGRAGAFVGSTDPPDPILELAAQR